MTIASHNHDVLTSTHRRLVLATLAGVLVISAIAIVSGWRMVVIRSGSMGERAPVGSLAFAAATDADNIGLGDMLVMKRSDGTPVTHAVAEIIEIDGHRHAITRGEANDADDPQPYLLEGEVLRVRAVAPQLGTAVEGVRSHWLGLLLIVAALYVVAGPQEGSRPERTGVRRRPEPVTFRL